MSRRASFFLRTDFPASLKHKPMGSLTFWFLDLELNGSLCLSRVRIERDQLDSRVQPLSNQL